MAALRKRHGRYYLDWRQNGLRHNRYVGKDKHLAEVAFKDLETRLHRQNLLGFTEKSLLEKKDPEINWAFQRWFNLNPRERLAIIFVLYKGKCIYCKREVRIPLGRERKLSPDWATIDHRIPFIAGGPDCLDNMILSCLNCNQKKGDQSYEEFMAKKV